MAGRGKSEEILLCGNRPERAILLKLTAIVGSSGAAGMGRGAEALIEAEQKANATGASAWGHSSGDCGDAFSSAGAGIPTQEGKALWRERWETSMRATPAYRVAQVKASVFGSRCLYLCSFAWRCRFLSRRNSTIFQIS